mmetsp:Transcript_29459/g.65247  ORF Transcript_29459/g.65247 Transcript_29459/m.65247 type:complete len:105 (-) Transcript_29459:1383-1697(-)
MQRKQPHAPRPHAYDPASLQPSSHACDLMRPHPMHVTSCAHRLLALRDDAAPQLPKALANLLLLLWPPLALILVVETHPSNFGSLHDERQSLVLGDAGSDQAVT